MRIAIMGTGGVGGYFGGRLAAAGHNVWFIARGEHLRTIRESGLTVASTKGDFVIFPAQATDDPHSVGAAELVVVAVKTWQLPQAAEQTIPLVGEDTIVLPLLNGVEAVGELSKVLPAGNILGGLCKIISYVEAPGRIRHQAAEPTVVFGETDNQMSDRVESMRALFEGAGVNAEIAPDLAVAVWTKFMLISTWSGIGAVTRAPVGVWRSLPGTRAMAETSLEETRRVGRALGVALSPELIAESMAYIDRISPDGTASMQRDITEGRPSELESQSGAVVRLGSEAGVPTPTHEFFYSILLPQETAARRGL